MRKVTLFQILLLSVFATSGAQGFYGNYDNEWYVPTQEYVEIKTMEDGIYRIYPTDLPASSPLRTADFDKLQLLYRGEEQYIYVEDDGTGKWSFFEFHGQRHDGRADSIMYKSTFTGKHDPAIQTNIHRSIFTDSAVYFLTATATPSTHRYTTYSNTAYSSFSPETKFRAKWHFDKLDLNFPYNDVNKGGGWDYDYRYLLNSDYILGEGPIHRGNRYNIGAPLRVILNLHGLSPFSDPWEVRIRNYGRSDSNHDIRVEHDGNVILTDNVTGVYINTYTTTIDTPPASPGEMWFYANGTGSSDLNMIPWMEIYYDRTFELNGENSVEIESWDRATDAYMRFEETVGTSSGWVWDLENHVRISGTVSSGPGTSDDTLKVIVPGASGNRKMVMLSDAGFKTPAEIGLTSLSNLSDTNSTAEMLLITHRKLQSSAEAYKNYRDTTSQNPLEVKIVYTDQIYDEFGHGIKGPYAIKQFCKYAIDNYSLRPEYVLLWGKPIGDPRRFQDQNLVPTYGFPFSDYEYVSNFDPNNPDYVPKIAIGRLSVTNNDDAQSYIEKVDDYEHTSWKAWMKNTLFMGGGGNSGEQTQITNYLNSYMDIEVASPVGADPFYVLNKGTGTVTNTSLTTPDIIKNGVNLVQFFGHSNTNLLDVDIQGPAIYENYGKYPLMVAFGCYGGNFATNKESFGESWVTRNDRGAIGYIANSDAGFIGPLGLLGQDLHAMLYEHMLGQPLGLVTQQMLSGFYTKYDPYVASGVTWRNHGRQLNFQGDPSVVLWHPKKPDLAIGIEDVIFEPENFTARDDSFTVKLIIHNNGLTNTDSFAVQIKQNLPTGVILDHPQQRYHSIRSIDTVSIVLYNTVGTKMAGLNNFNFYVDVLDSLDEYDETNNEVSLERIIPGNFPAVVYPYDYAIVPEAVVELQASALTITRDDPVHYVFEIDTTYLFNSGAKRTSGWVEGKSFLGKWTVPFSLEENKVYYWRVRIANVDPPEWTEASFRYEAGKTGWSQARLSQFREANLSQVSLNLLDNEWLFDNFSRSLHAYTYQLNRPHYRLEGGFRNQDVAAPDGVFITGFDKRRIEPTLPYSPSSGEFGDWRFVSTASTSYIISAINNLENGDFFLMTSSFNPFAGNWPAGLYDALEDVGCSSTIRTLENGESFIILGRKGFPNSAIEILEPNLVDSSLTPPVPFLDLQTELITKHFTANVTSSVVGPAMGWDELVWDWSQVDLANGDAVHLTVTGLSFSGLVDSVIYDGIAEGTFDLSLVNADHYPYLRLEASFVDSINLTSPQLNQWKVYYEPGPDAIIDPITNFSFHNDTIDEGDDVRIGLHLLNVGKGDLGDSIRMKFILKYPDRSELVLTDSILYPPLMSEAEYDFDYSFSTLNKNLDGDARLQVEVNWLREQPEQNYFNNLFSYPFYVRVDKINPILDVTFDGKHIMDGDIVSPNTEIIIQINDDNEFIAVNDTAYEIFFGQGMEKADLGRVYVSGNPQIEVVPAELPDNKAQIIYKPGYLIDGEYMMTVQGYDSKGNAAGKTDYEISFNVINQRTVSDILNYPNPFSSRTQFVYTLTGDQIPDEFKIYIYTITGRLVKTIDLLAEGDVHIGYNISNYAWDGRDEFGDQLANGVYLYKVVTKFAGEQLDKRDEGISDFFNKQGFGKMYLMR